MWMSHVSCEWVLTHERHSLCLIWMHHVSREWVMSHIQDSHVSYKCVMPRVNASCLNNSYNCVTSHIHDSHVSYECVRPTQSMIYVPLQVNRFEKFILLIVQYNIWNPVPKIFPPESDPPHKIMRYWVYYSTQLCFWFPCFTRMWLVSCECVMSQQLI